MSKVLNQWLNTSYNALPCELWKVEELQQLQALLWIAKSSEFDSIYQETTDNRRLRHHLLQVLYHFQLSTQFNWPIWKYLFNKGHQPQLDYIEQTCRQWWWFNASKNSPWRTLPRSSHVVRFHSFTTNLWFYQFQMGIVYFLGSCIIWRKIWNNYWAMPISSFHSFRIIVMIVIQVMLHRQKRKFAMPTGNK